MEESVYKETNDNGDTVKEIFGTSKILDPMLLEEIIQYNDEGNYDRIVAAELAIAQAIKMDPIMGRVGGSGDPRVKALFMNREYRPLFTESRGLFNRRKHKLFV